MPDRVESSRPTALDVVIEVPSGRITVGDADGEESFEVTRGRWLLEIVREPVDHPERVALRFSPAPASSGDSEQVGT